MRRRVSARQWNDTLQRRKELDVKPTGKFYPTQVRRGALMTTLCSVVAADARQRQRIICQVNPRYCAARDDMADSGAVAMRQLHDALRQVAGPHRGAILVIDDCDR